MTTVELTPADVTSLTSSISDDHRITPRLGSARRVSDGSPADLTSPLDYPVTAICLVCGRAIRCERYMSSDWEHTEARGDDA